VRLLKALLVALIGFAVLFLAVGWLLPDSARMERSVVIDAPPERIFERVNDLKAFNEWSPWYARDTDAQYRYTGPPTGVGSAVEWSSEHPEVGSGRQEIVESRDGEYVRSRLEFGPRGEAESWISLEPDPEGTRVTWGFSTRFGNNLMGRYFGLLLEDMLAPDYEAGLALLKQRIESSN
jgi:hypothetical protein